MRGGRRLQGGIRAGAEQGADRSGAKEPTAVWPGSLVWVSVGAQRAAAWRARLAAAFIGLVASAALLSASPAMAATTGTITGEVTSAASKAPVAEVTVCAQNLFGNEGCAATDSSGEYTLSGLPEGEYKVGFFPSSPRTQNLLSQYYNEKPSFEAGDSVTVTGAATTPNINAALKAGGQISGKVTDAASKAPLEGVEVCVEGVDCVFTDSAGEYTFGGLPTGEYVVSFSRSGYATQYYNGKASSTEADKVSATAGKTTPNINAALIQLAGPVITEQPQNLTVTVGEPASFKAAASGIPAPTVQWQVSTNGGTTYVDVPGAKSATLSIPVTQASESGHKFRAVFKNAEGSATTEPATLTVKTQLCAASPTIQEQPSDQTVTAPTEAIFAVKEGAIPPNCSPASPIQWQVSTDHGVSWRNVSGSNFSGANSLTLKIKPTSAAESGHAFRAVLSNEGGETFSAPATLTVKPGECAADPEVREQPFDQTVTAPAEATFKVREGVVPPNCAPASIQWQVSTNTGLTWEDISGATSETLRISPTAVGETGHEFRAVLTNADSESDSFAAILTVNKPTSGECEADPVVAAPPVDQTVTQPAEATFKVKEGAVPPNCAAASIQWQVSTNTGLTWENVSGSNFSGATTETLKISPTNLSETGHEFRAVLTNAHSETDSFAAILTVNKPTSGECEADPAVAIPPVDQTVTEPAEATFKVKEGAVPPNCAPASIQWQVSTNTGLTWENVSGSNFSGATTETLKISPTNLSETGHEFRAVLTNAHSSTDSEAATLTVTTTKCEADPAVAEQPTDQTASEGSEATFKVKEGAVPANCAAASIQWQVSTNLGVSWENVSGPHFSGATGETLKISPTAASETGHEFRAVLTNAHSSTDSQAAILTVEPEPTKVTATCGNAAVGKAVEPLIANRKRVNRCVLPGSALVSELSIYLSSGSSSGEQLIEGILYADSHGQPGALLGTTEQLAFKGSSAPGWYHLSFAKPLALTAGRYWIGMITGATAKVADEHIESADNAEDYNADSYASGPSDPFGKFAVASEQMSLYATYEPVGPQVFGNTSVGRFTDEFIPNRKRVNRYALPLPGSLSKLSVYLEPTGTPGRQVLQGVVYSDSSGKPQTLLGAGEPVTFSSTGAAGWYDLQFAAPLKLAAGSYWIGVLTGPTSHVAGFRFNSVPGSREFNANPFSSGPSDPFGVFSTDDEQMSLFATYTAATTASARAQASSASAVRIGPCISRASARRSGSATHRRCTGASAVAVARVEPALRSTRFHRHGS
jgi:hypothetical protein